MKLNETADKHAQCAGQYKYADVERAATRCTR